MTGLSVLYAKEAAGEREWAAIPDRDRTGRLREVYWARRAELKSGRKSFVGVNLNWRADRTEIGRRRDDPGDGFIYLVDMTPQVEDRFEWLEVTEVFTTVPASRIEGAMRAWNGIADKHPVDFDEFRKGLRRGRPSRMEQRRAADQVIAQIERKLAKTSYHELLERYGYGTLVVGLPLWFAVLPEDPWRAENAVDDFVTRTTLGLEDVRQRALRRRDCPFRNVIVIWDTTPQALREWRKRRCAEYEDAANTSLENPMPASFWGVLSDAVEEAVSKTATPESEAPSMCFHVGVKTRKKASGTGPYPKLVEALRGALRERDENPIGLRAMLKWRVALTLCKLLCFVRVHGVKGLERWIARKFSVSHAWRATATRRVVQHKMSLKMNRPDQGTLRVNASHHATCRTSHPGRDAGVSRRQQQSQLRRHRPQADLRPSRGRLAQPKIPRLSQEGQRNRAPLSGQDQRAQRGPNHPLDRPLARARRDRAANRAALSIPAALHKRRYPSAGHHRWRPRRPLGSGHTPHPAARIQGPWSGQLRTIGLDLGLSYLQLAPHPDLSRTACPSHQDPCLGSGDRRAAQARAARPAWLLAGRRRAPRRQRLAEGNLSHQCRRHGHAMAECGLLRNHLRGPI